MALWLRAAEWAALLRRRQRAAERTGGRNGGRVGGYEGRRNGRALGGRALGRSGGRWGGEPLLDVGDENRGSCLRGSRGVATSRRDAARAGEERRSEERRRRRSARWRRRCGGGGAAGRPSCCAPVPTASTGQDSSAWRFVTPCAAGAGGGGCCGSAAAASRRVGGSSESRGSGEAAPKAKGIADGAGAAAGPDGTAAAACGAGCARSAAAANGGTDGRAGAAGGAGGAADGGRGGRPAGWRSRRECGETVSRRPALGTQLVPCDPRGRPAGVTTHRGAEGRGRRRRIGGGRRWPPARAQAGGSPVARGLRSGRPRRCRAAVHPRAAAGCGAAWRTVRWPPAARGRWRGRCATVAAQASSTFAREGAQRLGALGGIPLVVTCDRGTFACRPTGEDGGEDS